MSMSTSGNHQPSHWDSDHALLQELLSDPWGMKKKPWVRGGWNEKKNIYFKNAIA